MHPHAAANGDAAGHRAVQTRKISCHTTLALIPLAMLTHVIYTEDNHPTATDAAASARPPTSRGPRGLFAHAPYPAASR